jgi:hypothetical protein
MPWLNRKLSWGLLLLASKALRLAAWFEERGGPLPSDAAFWASSARAVDVDVQARIARGGSPHPG